MNADMRGAAEPQAKRNISPRRHGDTEKSQSNSQKIKSQTLNTEDTEENF